MLSFPLTPGSRKRLFAAYLVVLAFNVALIAVIYQQGSRVVAATAGLVNQGLPMLQDLSRLRAAVLDEEPAFYEYYITGDRSRLLRRHRSDQGQIEASLKALGLALPEDRTTQGIAREYQVLVAKAQELDAALAQDPPDRKKAKRLVASVYGVCDQINRHLDLLASKVERGVSGQGQLAQHRVGGIVWTVALFGAVAFLVAVLIGYYVNGYIAETKERRRLAMFPERNPNPVLSLAQDGTVVYANPGAVAMLNRIGMVGGACSALLPRDAKARLANLIERGGSAEQWEYQIAGRTFGCEVHLLPDFRLFHVYLWDITERKRAEQQLIHQAFHDALTGLPNRRRFEQDLERALRAADGGQGAVLLLNLDRFRRVVDAWGPVVAEEVLRAVAEKLARSLVTSRVRLYRFEGDLFAVLVDPAKGAEDAVELAKTIKSATDAPLAAGGRELFVTWSIGLSLFPEDGGDCATLVKKADSALREVQRRGGNGYQCCTPELDWRALERLELENALQRARERRELELFYQPQLDVATGKIVGAEALIRWRHPHRGSVSPGDFIPLAEESGLILPIGEWVLESACAQAAAWRRAGFSHLTVAVNLSTRQFIDPWLPDTVSRILMETGLPPSSLELEITESAAMSDVEQAVFTLAKLKRTGVRLSIDDFGTGYSSLAYLKRFPIDKLKLDQSFVDGLANDAADAAIARAVIALGHSLKLKVIAEGVETAEQLAVLRFHQCDEIQGYFAAPPLPAPEFLKLLEEGISGSGRTGTVPWPWKARPQAAGG